MKPWIYTQNPFLNGTAGSFLNAMGISTYHDSALAAATSDAFIASLYTSFHPLHQGYRSAYDSWLAQGGMQQSETLNLTQLLHLLSTKIQQWDIKIQNIYPQSSVQYKKLLPNRRVPFQKGNQTERISAVKALSEAIGTDAELVTVKNDVDNFYEQLDEALTIQKGSKSTTKSSSAAVENARVAMCTAMYANFGALLQKNAANPESIEKYFDLQAIRNSQQVLFTGHVKAGAIHTIVKHTFDEEDELLLANNGSTPLLFYLAPAKNAQPGEKSFTLGPGEQKVFVTALGKLTDTYLTVKNPEASIAEFEVEIL
jgi:hypothetical protein